MIHHGDCLEVMATLPAASVDAVVTDPPYGIGFMGREWDDTARMASVPPSAVRLAAAGRDPYPKTGKGPAAVAFDGRAYQSWCQQWAEAAYRVAKPSAYLLAFGGTRTVHRLTSAIEDAGWIIRDVLTWGFASGFPKSKASLKPAYEPIVWARKPFRVPVEWWDDVHHALAALLWLNEGAPEGVGCASTRVASLFAASDPTDTSRSRAVASTSSSIASSWASILDALSADGSRYTTSTATRLTTALRTLSSSLSPVISVTTVPRCGCLRDGSSSPAESAASGSSDEHTRWLATLRRSVPETAIEPIARVVAGVCAAIADDLSDDLGAARTAPQAATTRLAADSRPIVLARKPGPLRELAIDACRIGVGDAVPGGGGWAGGAEGRVSMRRDSHVDDEPTQPHNLGRWPANIVLTDPIFDGGWEGVVGGGEAGPTPGSYDYGTPDTGNPRIYGQGKGVPKMERREGYGDSGTYSRFFIIPKADRADREPVLTPDGHDRSKRFSTHPTVKPTDLMRHLVRLVTPTGGTVLDPFLGSGTTAIACELEGFEWTGIEREAEYVAIAEARLNGTQRGLGLGA